MLKAARKLFVERGYSQTSLRVVAEAAGVSQQTIYATFGTKGGLVKALVQDIGVDAAGAHGPEELLAAAENPRRQLRLMAAFDRRLFERGGAVIALLRDAGRSEPELQSIYRAARERARKIHRSVFVSWQELGALRQGRTADEATDIYGALANFDVFRELVRERKWSADDYERWLIESVDAMLLT